MYFALLHYTEIFSTVLHCNIQYHTALQYTVPYCTAIYSTVLHRKIQYRTAMLYTVPYCTAIYSIVQHCTIQYCTVVHCTSPYKLHMVLYSFCLMQQQPSFQSNYFVIIRRRLVQAISDLLYKSQY